MDFRKNFTHLRMAREIEEDRDGNLRAEIFLFAVPDSAVTGGLLPDAEDENSQNVRFTCLYAYKIGKNRTKTL